MIEKAAPIPRRVSATIGIFAAIGVAAVWLQDAWIGHSLAPWMSDDLALTIVAVARSAFVLLGSLTVLLALRPEGEGAYWGRLVGPAFLVIAMEQGGRLGPLLAHRPGLAAGIALVQGLTLVLTLTWLFGLAGHRPGVGAATFQILMLGMINTSMWFHVVSSQGLRATILAFAVAVGVRVATLAILGGRSTAADNRREIEAYRARREPVAAPLEA